MSGGMGGGPGGGPGGPPGGFGGPGRSSSKSSSAQGQDANGAQAGGSAAVKKPLWYLDDSGKLAAVMVEVGMSDSSKTEVIGAESLEGKKIILKVKAE